MAIFEKLQRQKQEEFSVLNVPSEPQSGYESMSSKQEFSTPFLKVGDGNLSLPYINNNYTDARGYVRFGVDNLFPQLINQMYYTSPLNGAIINFKTNAVSGGGYEIDLIDQSPEMKARTYIFENKNKVKRTYKLITRDLIQHESCYFRLFFDVERKVFLKSERISPEKVRKSKGKKVYYICEDWSTQIGAHSIMPYCGKIECEQYILAYEIDSVGQDEYSIPSYSSSFNWCFLDGEMAYLHKSNIQNSIFPAFALLFPKKPNSDKEKQAMRDVVENAKGAKHAGRIFALFANSKEQLPEIAPIPTNQNDDLFEQTDDRIDAQVCKAHCIDPLLMGIRVSGKLGSGNDIEKSYTILEKNTIMPKREEVEDAYNQLLAVAGIRGNFSLRNYQIINDEIVEKEGDDNRLYDQLIKLSPLVANKVLDSLTINEIRGMGGAQRIKGGDKVLPASTAEQPETGASKE